ISPDLLQSYVRGRSRAPRKEKAEKEVASTSGDRPGARKRASAPETTRSLPVPSAPPARTNATPGEELIAEDMWGDDDDLVTGPVDAS
ncbi:MAG: hypothetical protein ACRENE_19650, partial [Polyangiaceae bacterium]